MQPALVAEITSLGRAGHTLRAIERATGIRRERVSAILLKAGVAVGKARLSATTATASAPIVATDVTATVDGHARGDPGGHRAIADEPFSWNFAVGHGGAAVVPEATTSWSYPMELHAVHVRALREGVAVNHQLVDSAARIGIDRWIGRTVGDLAEVAMVVAEIKEALTVARGRIRR